MKEHDDNSNDNNNDNNNNNNDDDDGDDDIKLYGKRILIDNIPQYIVNYSRGNDLELYIVTSKQ